MYAPRAHFTNGTLRPHCDDDDFVLVYNYTVYCNFVIGASADVT